MLQPRATRSAVSRVLMWFVLVLALGYLGWDAITRSRQIQETSVSYGVTVDAPAIDSRSATGYADGRRSMILPAHAADTAHWIAQTQMMMARGEWRVRHVDYDNAPDGREVHWAAPFHWWLGAIAWVDHTLTGRPLGISVERAVLWSGPLMLALILLGLGPLLARAFSPLAAVLAAVGMVTTYSFYIDFVVGAADHHGLANTCGLLTVLFLLTGALKHDTGSKEDQHGLRAPSETGGAALWFVASAVAGGLGLWISAATLIPVLIGIGVGALAATWIARGPPKSVAWIREPGLFRLWGLTGGGVSILVYLLEYFPSHLGWRLEVNHPLHAAAWVGAGEVLRVAALASAGRKPRVLAARDLACGAAGLALIALLPVVVIATATRTFAVADPFLWKFHALYISEFQGLTRLARRQGTREMLGLCLPALLLLPLGAAVFRSTTPRTVKALLVFGGSPALLAWCMGFGQIRWLSLAFALTIPALALFFARRESVATSRNALSRWALACALMFLPGAIGAVQRTRASSGFTRKALLALAERDVAHWLRLRAGEQRVVVAAAPSPTSRLIYHGGLAGLGTLYWENAAGLRHASELFAAPTDEAARALALRLGVTHIVLFSWDAFEVVQAKLYRGIPEAAAIPADLFIANLLKAPVPPAWLRAVPFALPKNPALEGEQVRIWEVVPAQTPAEVAAHAAAYYLDLGKPEIAAQLAPALAPFRDDLAATVMLAGLASRTRDAAGFSSALARVRTLLPGADALALDDHLHLVVVLAVAEQLPAAREQLQACLRKVNDRSLRALTPGTLSDLLALTEALDVGFADPALKTLAQQLVPPARRK